MVQDAPLSSLGSCVQHDVEQEHDYQGGSFGDSEKAPSSEIMLDVGALSAELETPLDSSAAASTEDSPLASAFDARDLVENSLLPSLGVHNVAAEINTADGNDGRDEFGGFWNSLQDKPPQIVPKIPRKLIIALRMTE